MTLTKPKTVYVKTPPELATTDTSDSDSNPSDSDYDDIPEVYQEKKWDSGFNYKSKAPTFAKAATNLRSLLRKSAQEKKNQCQDKSYRSQ